MKIIVTGPEREFAELMDVDEVMGDDAEPVFAVALNGELYSHVTQREVGEAVQGIVDDERAAAEHIRLVQGVVHVDDQVKRGTDVGTVAAYGRASDRYQVKWASGDEGWYPRDELEVC